MGLSRRVWLWVSVALVCVLVAAGVGYVFWPVGSEDSGCPPRKDATGVMQPEHVDAQQAGDYLEVVDSGVKPYRKIGGAQDGMSYEELKNDDADEGMTFGYVLKNTSDYVLYGAKLTVHVVDGDGREPLTELKPSVQHVNSDYLDEVRLPVLFPGQQLGLGGDVESWRGFDFDGDGKEYKPDRVDYDDLRVKVELLDGQWWKPDNDRYVFNKLKASNVDFKQKVYDGAGLYSGDRKKSRADTSYTVVSRACKTLEGYGSTGVAYDGDGDIIGGASLSPYPDEGSVYWYEPGSSDEEVFRFIHAPMDDGMTIKVFPYAKPSKPALNK